MERQGSWGCKGLLEIITSPVPTPSCHGQGHLSLGQVAQSHLAGAAEVRGWDALGFVLGFL